ncbi:copper resistance protein CopD [Escherichia albertii]|nr:copper resistance protein CopD [Escherichia albertii]
MLAFTWIALRFIHFISLMLVFGFAMYGAWLAPVTIRRLLTKRFLRLQQYAAVWSLSSTTAIFAVQGGMMGTGWADVISPEIWQALLQTQFGGVWLWQIVLALVTLTVALMQPGNMSRLLFMLTIALANRYVLVPRMGQDEYRAAIWFVWMTKLEWVIGAVVLVIISLLATLKPF